MRVEIEYQDQFGHWKQYTTKHNERAGGIASSPFLSSAPH